LTDLRTATADDDDPVKAEYDIFITPQLAEDLYLLQYPNRNRRYPYNERGYAKPMELRVKPKAGFLEIDVPVNVNTTDFDKAKGVRWGDQMRKSKQSGLESFGLSSGFTQYNSATNGRRLARSEKDDDESDEDVQAMIDNFNDSTDRGLVLNRQTLGGQLLREEPGKPLYMVGAFRGSVFRPCVRN
jgi:DNA-directed RNA polymerase III subunit RPC5